VPNQRLTKSHRLLTALEIKVQVGLLLHVALLVHPAVLLGAVLHREGDTELPGLQHYFLRSALKMLETNTTYVLSHSESECLALSRAFYSNLK